MLLTSIVFFLFLHFFLPLLPSFMSEMCTKPAVWIYSESIVKEKALRSDLPDNDVKISVTDLRSSFSMAHEHLIVL